MELLALAIFLVALALIALDWGHRTSVAFAGAALMVVLGVLDQEHAIESVDWATIGLLALLRRTEIPVSPTVVQLSSARQADAAASGFEAGHRALVRDLDRAS